MRWALQLKREFSTAESSRKLIEERWLEDLMQYRGQYPADVMERLKKFKRSQVYYRMTTNKVDMMVARLMDLLFPARSKNWAIQPTPDPEIPGELVEQSPEFMQAVQEVMAEQMQILQAQKRGSRRALPCGRCSGWPCRRPCGASTLIR